MSAQPLLRVSNLSLRVGASGAEIVKNVSFEIAPGEIVGVVGESGSGKTMATRAIIRLLPAAIRFSAGAILFKDREVRDLPARALRRLRGREVGAVFQEPMTSLNPAMPIGRQLEEGLMLHTDHAPATRRQMILAMLEAVGIADPTRALAAYPHEYSGGMRQRIMLASVMLLKPALLIADEPTTALDAIVQRDVMELMVRLTQAEGTAVLLISHDLPMVARYADRVIVMEQGAIVEQGATADMLRRPVEDYTRKLLSSLPVRGPVRALSAADPIISVRDLVVDYPGRRTFLKRGTAKRALHGISLDVLAGEVVALVGGSGSGKTTLGRTIAGLVPASGGEILFEGRQIDARSRDYRLNCQMVFQDPYSSLDPRMTILALGRGRAAAGCRGSRRPRSATARIRCWTKVSACRCASPTAFPMNSPAASGSASPLPARSYAGPGFVIADEPVSALDVTVRAQVLALLSDLQRRYGFFLPVHQPRPGRSPSRLPTASSCWSTGRIVRTGRSERRVRPSPTPLHPAPALGHSDARAEWCRRCRSELASRSSGSPCTMTSTQEKLNRTLRIPAVHRPVFHQEPAQRRKSSPVAPMRETPSASTRKISIMMAALKAVHEGRLDLGEAIVYEERLRAEVAERRFPAFDPRYHHLAARRDRRHGRAQRQCLHQDGAGTADARRGRQLLQGDRHARDPSSVPDPAAGVGARPCIGCRHHNDRRGPGYAAGSDPGRPGVRGGGCKIGLHGRPLRLRAQDPKSSRCCAMAFPRACRSNWRSQARAGAANAAAWTVGIVYRDRRPALHHHGFHRRRSAGHGRRHARLIRSRSRPWASCPRSAGPISADDFPGDPHRGHRRLSGLVFDRAGSSRPRPQYRPFIGNPQQPARRHARRQYRHGNAACRRRPGGLCRGRDGQAFAGARRSRSRPTVDTTASRCA